MEITGISGSMQDIRIATITTLAVLTSIPYIEADIVGETIAEEVGIKTEPTDTEETEDTTECVITSTTEYMDADVLSVI
jgi:hypothetical protein